MVGGVDLTTCAGLGELLVHRRNDIDFNARTAMLHTTKNGDPRMLTLPTQAIAELHEFREIGNGRLFLSLMGATVRQSSDRTGMEPSRSPRMRTSGFMICDTAQPVIW